MPPRFVPAYYAAIFETAARRSLRPTCIILWDIPRSTPIKTVKPQQAENTDEATENSLSFRARRELRADDMSQTSSSVPVAILPPRHQRTATRGSVGHSRSSSIDSVLSNAETSCPYPIQRWNGVTREATDWNSLHKDLEIFVPNGNCLIYLFGRGSSRRGPSFRIDYDFLLYSSCRPLIEQSLLSSVQTRRYHPGSATPPSYENLLDPSSNEQANCSLYLDAPAGVSPEQAFRYHVTTRNFFAWLVGVPLVGTDPSSALLDLKMRMDVWRDLGADNLAALTQYIKEQGYGEIGDLDTPEDEANKPRPYQNLSQDSDPEKEPERGRRASVGQHIRSASRTIQKKLSRTRLARENGTKEADSHAKLTPTAPTPPLSPTTTTPLEPEPSQKLKKRTSTMDKIKKHMSWLKGPLNVREADLVDMRPFTPTPAKAEAPGQAPAAAPAPAQRPNSRGATGTAPELGSARAALSVQTQNLSRYKQPHAQSAPVLNSPVAVQSSAGPSSSQASLSGGEICPCCGRRRRPGRQASMPSVNTGFDSFVVAQDGMISVAPRRSQDQGHRKSRSLHREITIPMYGNGRVSRSDAAEAAKRLQQLQAEALSRAEAAATAAAGEADEMADEAVKDQTHTETLTQPGRQASTSRASIRSSSMPRQVGPPFPLPYHNSSESTSASMSASASAVPELDFVSSPSEGSFVSAKPGAASRDVSVDRVRSSNAFISGDKPPGAGSVRDNESERNIEGLVHELDISGIGKPTDGACQDKGKQVDRAYRPSLDSTGSRPGTSTSGPGPAVMSVDVIRVQS